MKNRPFPQRLRFAIQGIQNTFFSESSFRTQILVGIGALGLLTYLRPAAIWWAIIIFAIGAVLSAELINTALEKTLDLLHPAQHPAIAVIKDCAAAAVLVLSFSALGIFIALISSYT